MPKLSSPLRKKREDRPIYVPQQRRLLLNQQKNASPDSSRVVELLGRYGRINLYEFEFERNEDAAHAASSYMRFGDFTEGGASLVRHVDAPQDSSMSRRTVTSRVMQADLEAAEQQKASHSDNSSRKRLLDNHELCLPSSQWDAPWKLPSKNNSVRENSMRPGTVAPPSLPPTIPKFPSYSRGRIRQCYSSEELGSGSSAPFARGDVEPSSQAPSALSLSNADVSLSNGRKDTDRSLRSSKPTKAAPPSTGAGDLDQKIQGAAGPLASTVSPVDVIKQPSFKAFEGEMHNKFPSAFSRRLLIAMWVSLCRSGITMDVLPDISSLTVRRAPEAQNGANSNAQAATERAVASASASSGVMSFHSAMDYLKGLLNHVSRILVPYESRKEADHFICYVCILLGDLCRYRDIHATKMLQKEVQEGSLPYKDYQQRNAELFVESARWYHQAAQHFPQEGRVFTQLSDFYFRKSDFLGQVSATLRSIICAFRNHSEDVLTVLLETGASDCRSNPFVSRLLSLVQSLYCKIGLDQFESRLEALCSVLRELILASVSSALLDTLLTAFQLLILMSVETSSLWQEDAAIGDTVDATVKSIKLKLVTSPNTEPVFTLNETETDYQHISSSLQSDYQRLSLIYAHLFQAHQKSVLEKVESNERFALTCIALCRLTVVVTKAVRSPLSPLLGILNMVFLWFSSTGLLHLFDACCDTKDTSLSQLKLGARALRSEFGTLRNSFSDLLVCCGKEMFEAKQLRVSTLQYALPEDQYLVGCVGLPVAFCVERSCSDDAELKDSDEVFSASLVTPYSSRFLDVWKETCERNHVRHYCCRGICSQCGVASGCQCFKGGHFAELPSFVRIDALLRSAASKPDPLSSSAAAQLQPQLSVQCNGNTQLASSFSGSLDNVSKSSITDPDGVPLSSEETDLSSEATTEEEEDTRSRRFSETELLLSRNAQPRTLENTFLDLGGEQTRSVAGDPVATDVQSLTPCDRTRRASSQDTPFPAFFRGTEQVIESAKQDNEISHQHLEAETPCLSNLVSLVRLSRLLVIAGTLDEFRLKCTRPPSITEPVLLNQPLPDRQIAPYQRTAAHEPSEQAAKQVDKTEERSTAGAAQQDVERRGLLRIDPTAIGKRSGSVVASESVSGKAVKERGGVRGRKKPWASEDPSINIAEARLFPTSIGGESMTRSRRSALGQPRVPCSTRQAPSCLLPVAVELQQPCRPLSSPSRRRLPSRQPLLGSTSSAFTERNPKNSFAPNSEPQAVKQQAATKRILIVIDGSNVALRHGSATSKKFSSAGIQITLDYYLKRSFDAIAFVPEYVTSYKDVGDNKRLQKSGVKANTASKIPDDIQLLRDLSDQGLLITTPPQDYDDSYIIQYAMNHGGFIVSNDRFRDHKRKESSKVRNWLKTHLISFTFILDEFMPNPDFVFPDE